MPLFKMLLKGLGCVLILSTMTLSFFVVWDKALTPFPQPQRQPSLLERRDAWEMETLRQELAEMRVRNATLEADNASLKLQLDTWRRGAVLLPAKGELKREDLIPAPVVPYPTRPEE